MQPLDPALDRHKLIAAENSDIPRPVPHPDLGHKLFELGINEVRIRFDHPQASVLTGDGESFFSIAFTTAMSSVGVLKGDGDKGRKPPTLDRPYTGVIELRNCDRDRAGEIWQRLNSEDGATVRLDAATRYVAPVSGQAVLPFALVSEPILVGVS